MGTGTGSGLSIVVLWLVLSMAFARSGSADPQLLEIVIDDASITLSPGQLDYETGSIAAEGALGIDVRVRTDNFAGLVLSVKCDDASPEIALSDLYFKTQTAPGFGGSSQSTYVAMQATDQDLWSTGTFQFAWRTVQTDIRIDQLWSYPDAAGAGVTTYTNTLTFTVVAP